MVLISSVIIDGYNLIGTAHRDLRSARDKLVASLSAYRRTKQHDITVVFDGWKSGGVSDSRGIFSGIQVIYTRLGDTADTAIKRIISSENKDWIVISSDREIVSYAWGNGAVPVRSDIFEAILEASGPDNFQDESAGLVSDPKASGKGRPGTLSKKEKALQRAIVKLS